MAHWSDQAPPPRIIVIHASCAIPFIVFLFYHWWPLLVGGAIWIAMLAYIELRLRMTPSAFFLRCIVFLLGAERKAGSRFQHQEPL